MAVVTIKPRGGSADEADALKQMAAIINALVTIVTELKADHATTRTELIAIGTTLADYKAIYDAHTHKLPATPAEDENTSAPDTTAATGAKAPGAASAFTDTSGSPPATLAAATPDSLTIAYPTSSGTSNVAP